MANETVVALPIDILEPQALKRSLGIVIQEIDKLLGYRGGDPALRRSQLEDAITSVENLENTLESLTQQAGQLQIIIDNALTSLRDGYWQSRVLDNEYYDFDFAGWNTLRGNFEFATAGSDLSNAPFTVTPTSSYYVLILAVPDSNNVAILRMTVVEDGVNTYNLTKAGGSWS